MNLDLRGKTVGIVGTGQIGEAFARIMAGFGCRILAFDQVAVPEMQDLGVAYVDFKSLCRESDIITLHVPLNEGTKYIINAESIARMKKGVMLINTGRGALIDTRALIEALKQERIGAAGLDVYEEEEGIFFQDLSNHVLQDDVLARLLTFPNVLVTSHQAFLTKEALAAIARVTLENVSAFERGEPPSNEVRAEQVLQPSGRRAGPPHRRD